MEIRERIRQAVGKSSDALEMGPAYLPIIAKREGFRTTVYDHAPRDELIVKYVGQPIDIDSIEEVDVVATSLKNVNGRFDHIVASHYVEHTTDLIEFLSDTEGLLKDGGKLHLITPDRRSIFDAFRPPTSTGHVIDAHVLGKKRHIGAIFDTFTNAVTRNGHIIWEPDVEAPYEPLHTYLDARAHTLAALQHTNYVDTHEWCFSPTSFRLIVLDVLGLGFIKLNVTEWQSDSVEFYCVLERAQSSIDLHALSRDRAALRDQLWAERR